MTNVRRNTIAFGLGTVGRDMLYTLVSSYLLFYLTDVLNLPNATMWSLTGVLLAARIFDAVNDPIMGVIVDNTRSRFGKFKPWIASGALFSGLVTVLLFTDFGLAGPAYVALFTVLYLLWDVGFTANDISYWSMMPALSLDQKERERIGAFARICANVGMFALVVGLVPLSQALSGALGGMKQAYFAIALGVSLAMLAGQAVTLAGVREPRGAFKREETTTLGGMVRALAKNDQLMIVAVSMVLFTVGYITTTSFGLYFFKYAYGDEGMYSIFALVLGVSQLASLAVFPLVSKRMTRRAMYTWSTVLVVLGYGIFFFSPMDMLWIGLSGILLFVGQAFIQLLMLMFLADSIEYGQWKLGKRNESVTFSIQPFINKMGAAIASGVTGAVVIMSGINDAATKADVTPQGLLLMKTAMLVFPLVCVLAGYVIWRAFFRIDEAFFKKILAELQARGHIRLEAGDTERADA